MNEFTAEIYLSLLRDISAGKLPVGSQLPTEMELAAKFNTNRMNAHRAVKQLEMNGIVERRKRRGTFVKDGTPDASILKLRNNLTNVVQVFMSMQKEEMPRNSELKLYSSYYHWGEETFSELENCLNSSGYKIQYADIPKSRSTLKEHFDQIQAIGAKSVVFFPKRPDLPFLIDNVDLFFDHQSEIFLVNRGTNPPDELPCHVLTLDPFSEGVMAARYMWQKYKCPILFIANTVEENLAYWAKRRLAGVRAYLKTVGCADFTFKGNEHFVIQQECYEFLRSRNEKVGIIALTDQTSSYYIDYFSENGMKAIDDYYLIAFDNDPRLRDYNLTTIAPPVKNLGNLLGSMIIKDTLHLNDGLTLSLRLQSRIIERNTA